MEKSAEKLADGDSQAATRFAREAKTKVEDILNFRRKHQITDMANQELHFAVLFQLAVTFQADNQQQQAKNAYESIIDSLSQGENSQNHILSQCHINMGNLFLSMGQHNPAKRHYNMAYDNVPSSNLEQRVKIIKNLAICAIRREDFADAIEHFDRIIEMQLTDVPDLPPDATSPEPAVDPQTYFNLVLCYAIMNERHLMRDAFMRMLDLAPTAPTERGDPLQHVDELYRDEASRQSDWEMKITTLARIIAPKLEDDVETGFQAVVDALKENNQAHVARRLEVEMALACLRQGSFDRAVALMESIKDTADDHSPDGLHTNLAFVYYVTGSDAKALQHAELAVNEDPHSAYALNMLGCCQLRAGRAKDAVESLLRAVDVPQTDCFEAHYNLGLAFKKLEQFEEAAGRFQQYLDVCGEKDPRAAADATWQLSDLYMIVGDVEEAIDQAKQLVARVPNDALGHARLGRLYCSMDMPEEAVKPFKDSAGLTPTVEVLDWLGAYYANAGQPARALEMFRKAGQLRPRQPHWRLMEAGCLRRMEQKRAALELYQRVLDSHPDSIEAMTDMMAIHTELGEAAAADKLRTRLAATQTRLVQQKEASKKERDRARSARTLSARRPVSGVSTTSDMTSRITSAARTRDPSGLPSARDTPIEMTPMETQGPPGIDGLDDGFDAIDDLLD